MSESRRNLYRIDDVLLRAAGVLLLLVVALAVGILVVGLAEGSNDGRDPGLAALGRLAPLLVATALCPAALLWLGLSLRGREKQIDALWKLLERNAELDVPALIGNSDFRRRDLERAVRFLNNRGLGHYVWDRTNDRIQDARLRTTELHLEKCEACGASVALMVPISFRKIPTCPFCDDPVSSDSLEERRREALEALRAEHRPQPSTDRWALAYGSDFSLPTFLILVFVFWPAGVAYAWWKWQGSR